MEVRLYRTVLRLYPEHYRSELAVEMLTTFERLLAERRRQGAIAALRFLGRELGGLLAGACRERMRCVPVSQPAADPDSVEEAQQAVRFHLAQTVDCIAHHRFARARFHAAEEDRARERLRTLIGHSDCQSA